ncbi:MAG: hypothetical protein ACRC2H_04600 [Silanimonas sp.]
MSRALLLLLALLIGCAQPLPPDRGDYVGEWRGKGVVLLITADGMVVHERKADGSSVSLNAPIKRFDGDDFEVGIGPMVTRFDVTEPPAEVDGDWRMTVDGRELRRVDDGAVPMADPDEESIAT